MTPTTPIWRLVLPFVAMGVGMAFIWSPLAATATRDLPPQLAGAGSGGIQRHPSGRCGAGQRRHGRVHDVADHRRNAAAAVRRGRRLRRRSLRLPGFLREPFSAAMSQSVLLPAFVALFGIVAALFLVAAPRRWAGRARRRSARPDRTIDVDDDDYDDDQYVEFVLVAGARRRAGNAIPSRPTSGSIARDRRSPERRAVTPTWHRLRSTIPPRRLNQSVTRLTTDLTSTAANACARWRCAPAQIRPARRSAHPAAAPPTQRLGGPALPRGRIAARPASPLRSGRRPRRSGRHSSNRLAGHRQTGLTCSARNAPRSTRPAGVAGRYSVSTASARSPPRTAPG